MILVLRKPGSHRAPYLSCRGGESPGWFDVLPKSCMRCEAWLDTLLWWSCQSSVAQSCGLLNHLNSFCGGMFKLNTKYDADSWLYSLSHWECDGHRVHMFSQRHLLPPLTSTIKSLFTHAHSDLLSLASRLHGCRTNHSHYINNGWHFSGQILYNIYNRLINAPLN